MQTFSNLLQQRRCQISLPGIPLFDLPLYPTAYDYIPHCSTSIQLSPFAVDSLDDRELEVDKATVDMIISSWHEETGVGWFANMGENAMRGKMYWAAISFAADIALGHAANAQTICYRDHVLPVAAETWQQPQVQQHFREKPVLAEIFASNTCGRKPHRMTETEIESLLEDLQIPQAIADAMHRHHLSLDALYAAIYWEHAVDMPRDGSASAQRHPPVETGSSRR